MKPTTSPTQPPTRGPSTQSHCHSLDVTGSPSSRLASTAPTPSAQSAISSHLSHVLVARGTTVNKTLGSSSSRSSNSTQPSQLPTRQTDHFKTPALNSTSPDFHLQKPIPLRRSSRSTMRIILHATSIITKAYSPLHQMSPPTKFSRLLQTLPLPNSSRLILTDSPNKKPFLSVTYSLLRQQCL